MKTKGTRWERDADGKPILVEFWQDQGPSYAAGVNRQQGGAAGKHRRGRARTVRPTGLIPHQSAVPLRGLQHPADRPNGVEGWQVAVAIGRAKRSKRQSAKDSGL